MTSELSFILRALRSQSPGKISLRCLFFVDASSPCHPCAVLFTLLDFVLWQLLLLQVLLLPLVSLSHLRPVTNVGKSTALVLRATQLLETNAMLTFSLFLQTLESKLTKHKSGSGARLCQSSKHTVLLNPTPKREWGLCHCFVSLSASISPFFLLRQPCPLKAG